MCFGVTDVRVYVCYVVAVAAWFALCLFGKLARLLLCLCGLFCFACLLCLVCVLLLLLFICVCGVDVCLVLLLLFVGRSLLCYVFFV